MGDTESASDNKDANIEVKQCNACKIEFDGDNIIGCDGECEHWFHPRCVGIRSAHFKTIQECDGIKWYCVNCRKEKPVKNIVDGSIKKYSQEISEIKKLINNLMGGKDTSITAAKQSQSYAKIINKPAIVIKPKTDKQECKETRKVVREIIKPSEISVGVTSVKNIKEGGIVVKCHKEEDIKKLKNEAVPKLGNKYNVQVTKLRNPSVKVIEIEKGLNETEIEEHIKAQNGNIFTEASFLKVKGTWERNNTNSTVVEVDSDTFGRLMKEGKINIEWERCPIYEELNILR